MFLIRKIGNRFVADGNDATNMNAKNNNKYYKPVLGTPVHIPSHITY